MLPRIPDPPLSKQPELRYSPAPGGETVLLVEDNMTVRKAAQRILSECGYQVLEAGSGAEAIGALQRHSGTVHLLVADLVMPGMNGRELGRQLRTERPDLRILYMSGYEPQEPTREEQGEPVVFFRKPFTGAALLDKVRQILDASGPTNSTKSDIGKREQP
jgi:CheY-like chemotaxis protein